MDIAPGGECVGRDVRVFTLRDPLTGRSRMRYKLFLIIKTLLDNLE
jgi:hypothetical protein